MNYEEKPAKRNYFLHFLSWLLSSSKQEQTNVLWLLSTYYYQKKKIALLIFFSISFYFKTKQAIYILI